MSYLSIAKCAAVALLLAAVYFAGHHAANAKWKLRAAEDMAAYNDELAKLTQETRQKELAAAERQAKADAQYHEDMTNVTAQKDDALARLRAGTLRLRDPGASAVPAASGPATPSRAPDSDGSGLSDELATFLVSEASRADALVAKYNECVAIAVSDRAP